MLQKIILHRPATDEMLLHNSFQYLRITMTLPGEAVSKLVNRRFRLDNRGPQMYPAVEIVPYKRNMGAGFIDSEHDMTFDPSSAASCQGAG